MGSMIERIGAGACYLGMAEEAAELSAVCAKMARILSNENPTPMTTEDCFCNIKMELTHLMIYANELSLTISNDDLVGAMMRFDERWRITEREKTRVDHPEDPRINAIPARAVCWAEKNFPKGHPINKAITTCCHNNSCVRCPIDEDECCKIASRIMIEYNQSKEDMRKDE